jgi:DNA-binding GntR family transcriptional regulator
MSTILPFQQQPSLHAQVAEQLREGIFNQTLPPGEIIDELAWCEQWGISRTPLREALKVLAAEGLVEPVARRGCKVVEMTDHDADTLFPLMALLEGRCALEATQRATDLDRRNLQRLHDELEHAAAARDITAYYQANHRFHTTVQALADNRWLDRVTSDLRRFVRLMRGRQLKLAGRIEASINEHRVLLAAMIAGDAQRAERAMHDHLIAQHAALVKLRAQEAKSAKKGGKHAS